MSDHPTVQKAPVRLGLESHLSSRGDNVPGINKKQTSGRVDEWTAPATVGAAVMHDSGLPLLVIGHSPWNADDSGPSRIDNARVEKKDFWKGIILRPDNSKGTFMTIFVFLMKIS